MLSIVCRIALSSAFHKPLVSTCIKRNFAAPAAGGKKKAKKGVQEEVVQKVINTHPIPINIFVDGKDPDVLPDDQYPPWLWKMLDRKMSVDEFSRATPAEVTESDIVYHLRKKSADTLKENNSMRKR